MTTTDRFIDRYMGIVDLGRLERGQITLKQYEAARGLTPKETDEDFLDACQQDLIATELERNQL